MKKASLRLPFTDRQFNIYGDEKDKSIFYGISLSNVYEVHIMNLFSKIIRPNSVCLDVGANIGCMSLAMGTLAPAGRIYSFEPSVSNYHYLIHNIYANNINNVECLNLGVLDENRKVLFNDINHGGGWSHIGVESSSATQHEITCVKLDDWVKTKDIKKINFIKMDIEGSEIKALRGALSILEKFKPDLIIEFNSYCLSELSNENTEDFYSLLKTVYPSIYVINHDSSLIEVDTYKKLLELTTYHGDDFKGELFRGDLLCSYN